MMMKLSELFDLPPSQLTVDPVIQDIELDSRKIKAGDLFFALSGTKQAGTQYIEEALEKGAVAIVIDEKEQIHLNKKHFSKPIIPIAHVQEKLGYIAAKFFDYPANGMTIIGVTGTNGKTSTCYLATEALEQLNKKVAMIGTLGFGTLHDLQSTGMTTPDAITLQKIFAKFKSQGIQYVVMEVSSHALMQGRVEGIPFKLAIFTNLTRDHLDYHQTMGQYAAAKRKLFSWDTLQYRIINADDAVGYEWLREFEEQQNPPHSPFTKGEEISQALSSPFTKREEIPQSSFTKRDEAPQFSFAKEEEKLLSPPFEKGGQGGISSCAYGMSQHVLKFNHHYLLKDLKISSNGMEFLLLHSGQEILIHSILLGRFNAYNLLAVMIILKKLGFEWERIIQLTSKLHGVPGRMQVLRKPAGPTVVVDFAHTPDALEQVLKTLRELKPKKLFCVFGCGGDRDRGKRPLMGRIADELADYVILTNDNPRTEDPTLIVEEIRSAMAGSKKYMIELDRKLAIKKAITEAQENDIVLLAGKGHESYQIIGETVYPFDDFQIAQQFLK